jgi:hypothetical protein
MANQKITELALIGGIDVSNDMIPIVDVSVAAGVGETKKVAPGQLKVALALDNVSNTSDANKPVSTATQTALDLKVDENAAITGATKTKITYDAKGLVTAGADLAASDLPTGIDAAKISSGVISNAEFDYLNGLSDNIQTQLNGKQQTLTLTTTGTSGAATLVGGTLNIPQYSGGGASGVSQIVAGTNVTISPVGGTGVVTINATGGGGGSGTVTNVSALTLGTTGTDLSSTVANSTTTPVITLNVPNASASNRGALTSTDWSTFNGKQNAITGAATTITTSDLTVSRALTSNASGKVAVSATTDTELGYVSGVTSAIQTQINTKQQTLSTVTTAQSVNGQVLQNFVPNQASTSVSLTLNSANSATYNSSVIALTGALTITFDASLPGGFNVTLIQLDAAISSIAGTGGLVIGNRQGHSKNNGQYSVVSIIKYTSVLAILGGDTSL